MRQVVICPGEDGYWVAECPSLAGCISQGKTREEAAQSIKEAIRGYIAALEADGFGIRIHATRGGAQNKIQSS
jgi:predicted RNase H-like HicB family nuclease